MLPYKILTQDEFTAVSLEQAKAQCRRLDSYTLDDEFITGLIADASAMAQEYLNWMVSTGTVKQYSPAGGSIQLYGKFVTTITDVTVDGESIDYTYNEVTETVTVDNRYVDVYITYACGASDTELPGNVRRGILMLISTMYNNREDFITGLSVENMPLTSAKLLSVSRIYVS